MEPCPIYRSLAFEPLQPEPMHEAATSCAIKNEEEGSILQYRSLGGTAAAARMPPPPVMSPPPMPPPPPISPQDMDMPAPIYRSLAFETLREEPGA